MKRTLPPLHLPRSPLIYVVAQVNISAVVAIDRYVPEIQERLRKVGFPGFSSIQVPELIFESPSSKPVVNAVSRFEFQDREGRTGIALTPKWIAVHTNQYKTFEKFREYLTIALETIHGAASLQLRERIGLRYVDLIELNQGESLGRYLAPHLMGYETAPLGVTEPSFDFKFEATTRQGRIVARHYAPPILNMLPPDLAGVGLNYSYRIPPPPGTASLLDFDHSTIQTQDFMVDEILETLESLHDSLDILFRNSVTEEALRLWGEDDSSRNDD
jgi:uncharacterized protein (TIGR04255 family)